MKARKKRIAKQLTSTHLRNDPTKNKPKRGNFTIKKRIYWLDHPSREASTMLHRLKSALMTAQTYQLFQQLSNQASTKLGNNQTVKSRPPKKYSKELTN
jgi:hypothetical protein